MKKVWEKPQLVVLVRGNPEESVLLLCKMGSEGPISEGAWFGGCTFDLNGICYWIVSS